jgi:hypothetical protein
MELNETVGGTTMTGALLRRMKNLKEKAKRLASVGVAYSKELLNKRSGDLIDSSVLNRSRKEIELIPGFIKTCVPPFLTRVLGHIETQLEITRVFQVVS